MDYRQMDRANELLERATLALEGILRTLESMTAVQAGSWVPGTRLKYYDELADAWEVVSVGIPVRLTQEVM